MSICTDCGEELIGGLLNTVKHHQECKRNALNVNIEYYWQEQNRKLRREQEEKEFAPIYKKMSKEEQLTLLAYSMCGMLDGNTILMGMEAFDRYSNFRNEMKIKYKNTI